MNKKDWTVGDLLKVSGSYWQAFLLHASVKLNVFSLIGAGQVSAEEVAKRLDCEVRGATMLLNALAAMGLLIKERDQYANTAESKSLLMKESPDFIGHMVMHHHRLVETWSQIDKAVKTGKPARKRAARNGEELESFLMGMYNLAMGIAPRVAEQIDLQGRNRLLDLGGGPGTYAIHFCLANPDLRATVFDLPTSRPFAIKTIEKFGLTDRVEFMAGDYLEAEYDFGGAYDVAWLSHILHAQGPDECQVIIDKAASALEPGGLLLVHDFIMEDTFDGPFFPALFSLNMLVNTEKGQSYSGHEIKEMLARAGLKNIQRLAFKGPNESGIISGVL